MVQNKFLSLFNNGWTLENHMILQLSNPIAILNPASLLIQENRKIHIKGKRGVFEIPTQSIEELIITLFASGSLIPGNPKEVRSVSKLLFKPEYSRTYAYFCSVAESCKQILDFEKTISESHVAIIGCGGIGSISAVLLAGIGIKSFTLIDFDSVEKSNLNRQILYKKSDIGKLKASVLKRELKSRFNNLNIEIIDRKISKENSKSLLYNTSGIIITADDPIGVHVDIIKSANKRNIPIVSCGYSLNESKLFLSPDIKLQNKTVNYQKLPQGIMPSYGPTNSEVAGIATSVITHAILGLIKDSEKIEMIWNNVTFPRTKYDE